MTYTPKHKGEYDHTSTPIGSPDDHSECEHCHPLWHVNVYEDGREYGGPEEGGWYYNTGTFRPEMSVTFEKRGTSEHTVRQFADALDARLEYEADQRGRAHVGSVLYRGGRYLVRIEHTPGADFPEERPYYC